MKNKDEVLIAGKQVHLFWLFVPFANSWCPNSFLPFCTFYVFYVFAFFYFLYFCTFVLFVQCIFVLYKTVNSPYELPCKIWRL